MMFREVNKGQQRLHLVLARKPHTVPAGLQQQQGQTYVV
jgi:hypothetical protein